jgi:phosphopantothenate-cysteine ligase
VDESIGKQLRSVCSSYQSQRDHLLTVTFTTLSDYLFYLREVTRVLKLLGSNAMLYLAAAVSDFYIPPENMATHKIQSGNGPLRLHFEMVPKILRPLIKYWVPDAFVISFKLETDSSILLQKARKALHKYGHKLVIANELQTRKHKVLFVTEDNQETIETSGEIEIEDIIVDKLIKRHEAFKAAFK